MKPRIISLLPSATEIVAALGLTDALVGRSHECDYPPEVLHLPVCTAARLNTSKSSLEIDGEVQSLLKSALSIYDIQTEVIDKLQPTHIVTQDQCDVCAVSFSEVKKAVNSLVSSQPQVISLQPNLLQEVWADIARVADALQVPSEPLLQQLKNRVEAIASITSTLNQRPKVVAIEWTDPLMGGGNWIPELIEIAGGEPMGGVAGEHSPYILWEELTQGNPEIIVIMPCGFDLERTREESLVLTKHPQWQNLEAVKQNRVYITDGNAYFNRPGPRLVDSLEILAEIIHGDRFNFGYENKAWQTLI